MKIGDIVTWTSQSGGFEKQKTGKVIAKIPAGISAKCRVPAEAKNSHIKFDDKSSNERVLVAVPAGKYGQITHYYCPLKSALEAQGNKIKNKGERPMSKRRTYDPSKDGAVTAIKIYNKGVFSTAILVFAFGDSKEIRWDMSEERVKYEEGINAYTLIYDERTAEFGRTFESFIKEKG